MYFVRFLWLVLQRSFYIYFKKKKELKWGSNYLKQLEKQFDGAFDKRTFNKILFYYSLGIPAICDPFLQLNGRKCNAAEGERLLNFFICSSVFDNFFDRAQLTDEEIYAITFNPEQFTPTTFEQRISISSHKKLLAFVEDKDKYLALLKKEYDTQVASRKQFNTTITDDEIRQITFDKGGIAVSMWCFYFEHNSTKAEENCLYKLGGIIQYVNDLYDIYRDLQTGLQTIPNRMQHVEQFAAFFDGLVDDLKTELNKINASKLNMLRFKISVMGIATFGYIALEQLQKLQGNDTTLKPLKSYSRKELIIDMEKMSNLLKWVKYTYKLSK